MNITVGPVLLDYTYVYKLDGKKLYCVDKLLADNTMCNGVIDYDDGFNNLVCSVCGKRYLATDLKDNSKVLIKPIKDEGDLIMKVQICQGDRVIREVDNSTDSIVRNNTNQNQQPRAYRNETIKSHEDTTIGKVIVGTKPKFNKNVAKKNYENKTPIRLGEGPEDPTLGLHQPTAFYMSEKDNSVKSGNLESATANAKEILASLGIDTKENKIKYAVDLDSAIVVEPKKTSFYAPNVVAAHEDKSKEEIIIKEAIETNDQISITNDDLLARYGLTAKDFEEIDPMDSMPENPKTGDTYVFDGVKYIWNGKEWDIINDEIDEEYVDSNISDSFQKIQRKETFKADDRY